MVLGKYVSRCRLWPTEEKSVNLALLTTQSNNEDGSRRSRTRHGGNVEVRLHRAAVCEPECTNAPIFVQLNVAKAGVEAQLTAPSGEIVHQRLA